MITTDRSGPLFLVPGVREVLRVNGRAYPTDEPDMLARMRIEGRTPPLALIVNVVKAYFHCGRALIRSRLWDPASQSLATEVPTAGEAAVAQLGLDLPATEPDKALQGSYPTGSAASTRCAAARPTATAIASPCATTDSAGWLGVHPPVPAPRP